MKVTLKEYLIFSLSIVLFSLIFYFIISFLFYRISFEGKENINEVTYNLNYSISIIQNNLRNFLQYFLLFLLSPIMIIFDIVINVYQIYVGIENIGTKQTFLLLYKHGLIEIPNMLLYMYLSIKCFYSLIKHKKLKIIFVFWKSNFKLYIISFVLIIIAGLIEGMVY